MSREQYRTPDEDVAAEFERVSHLFRLALGRPSDRALFDSLMSEANARGLNWVEGLEYVVERRRSGDNPAAEAVRRARGLDQPIGMTGELRKAG